jgi:hypothetical protein
MTDEQININVAEALGWTDCEHIESLGLSKGKHVFVRAQYPTGHSQLPNYCNDLNAMHEAEGHFKTATEQMQYAANVLKVRGQGELFDENDLNVDHCWIARSAAAHQCAEAFLRTIGKWEESE